MKKFAQQLIGIVVFLVSLSLGLGFLYYGLWHCFVLSAVDFINQCKLPTTDAMAIALDLFCFFVVASLSCTAGFYTLLFGCVFGIGLIGTAKNR